MFPDTFLWSKFLDFTETSVPIGAAFTQIARPRKNRLGIRFNVNSTIALLGVLGESAFVTTNQASPLQGGYQVTPITGLEFDFQRWGTLVSGRWYGRAIGSITAITVTEILLKQR